LDRLEAGLGAKFDATNAMLDATNAKFDSISQRLAAEFRVGDLARRAPYLSGIVMIGVGLYVGWEGWTSVSVAL
jgi:hypothetical protein